jgi:peptidoglycan/LPS O-acetylase OafA/YrhL
MLMTARYEELDSLRGLAALSVFFGHIYFMFKETLITQLLFKFGIFHFAIAGREAVILFFVLSGFVLSLPFYSDRPFSSSTFVIRRIFRIYIPYIVSIGVALLCREMFYTGNIGNINNWINESWSNEINMRSLKDHILLIGTFMSNLNNVVWSLVHEMRISIVFPFLMFLLVRMNWKKGIGLAIMISMVSVIYSYVTNARFLGTEFYATVHYTAMFVMGALLAKYRNEISKKVLGLSKKRRLSLFIVGLFLYLYSHPSLVLSKTIYNFNPFTRTVIDSWFVAVGASIIIIFAISSNRSNVLRNAVVKYLGKISFSLYLSHLPVLLSCIHVLHNLVPLWAICLIVVATTFVVSSLMYYLIERPAIILGKRLTGSHGKNSKERAVVANHAEVS